MIEHAGFDSIELKSASYCSGVDGVLGCFGAVVYSGQNKTLFVFKISATAV